MNENNSALVMFSGGQDSTICLAWALNKYNHVETIGFDYGQRHIVELEARKNVINSIKHNFPGISKKLGNDCIINMGFLKNLCKTSLTSHSEITIDKYNMPNTFVPGRNLIFLVAAATLAYSMNINSIIGGMCETDFSQYPDCKEDTILSMQNTLRLGIGNKNLKIETPLMHIKKSSSWELAYKLGKQTLIDIILEYTHTCYLGDRTQRNSWGYGCGECPSCLLRRDGWEHWSSTKYF